MQFYFSLTKDKIIFNPIDLAAHFASPFDCRTIKHISYFYICFTINDREN